MKTGRKILAGLLFGVSLFALAAPAWSASPTVRYAGLVTAVNKAGGTIVVGDTGPRLKSGESKITRHTIKVTSSTEFVRVKRASGAAASGWLKDYEETKLSAWEVKPGDWVAVALEPGKGTTAAKITVVDTSEP